MLATSPNRLKEGATGLSSNECPKRPQRTLLGKPAVAPSESLTHRPGNNAMATTCPFEPPVVVEQCRPDRLPLWPARRVLHVISGEHYAGAERVQDLLALHLAAFGFEVGLACLKPGSFPQMRLAAARPALSPAHARPLRPVARLETGPHHPPRRVRLDPFAHGPFGARGRGGLAADGRAAGASRTQSGRGRFYAPLAEPRQRAGGARCTAPGVGPGGCFPKPPGGTCASRASIHGESRLCPTACRGELAAAGAVAARCSGPGRHNRGHCDPGHHGPLPARKGLEILLQAVARLRGQGFAVRLRAVGSFETPQYEAHIRRLAAELGLDNAIAWTGFAQDVDRELAAMDLFVLPSLFGEGLPMVVLEAMAAGLPVVATRVEGVPEAVRDGREGLLVEPGNPDDLARAISRLIRGELDLGTLGRNAVGRHAERFSDMRMAADVAEIYRRVLGQNASQRSLASAAAAR